MAAAPEMRSQRMLAVFAAAGFIWFLLTAACVQAIRNHAIAATPISAYLRGPGSGWLRLAYYLLALALWALGTATLKLPQRGRARLLAALLGIGGLAVMVVVYSYGRLPVPGHPTGLVRLKVHQASALLAFTAVTLAMFVATPILWQRRSRGIAFAFTLAVLFIESLAGVAPLFMRDSYGALEKLSVAGLVIWLTAAAVRLAMRSRARDTFQVPLKPEREPARPGSES